MDYEFQESDIIFSDHAQACDDSEGRRLYDFHQMEMEETVQNGFPMKPPQSSGDTNSRRRNSPPVVIPCSGRRYDHQSLCFSGEISEMVPPHLIVGKRIAGKMSVCASNGRMLKGRHLNQLRNSILRITGFLESPL